MEGRESFKDHLKNLAGDFIGRDVPEPRVPVSPIIKKSELRASIVEPVIDQVDIPAVKALTPEEIEDQMVREGIISAPRPLGETKRNKHHWRSGYSRK